jgi:hypothetical protein
MLPAVSPAPKSVLIFNAFMWVLIVVIVSLTAYLFAESFLGARTGVIPGITTSQGISTSQ